MALTKAVIVKLDSPGAAPIPVMFNPPKYELAKTNRYAEIKVPGLPSAVLQFVGGDAASLSMELFFDTTDKGDDVRTRTEAIVALTEPEPISQSPPLLLFLWGSLAFPCVLVSARQTFDYFDAQGRPLRATLTVELKGYRPVESLLAAMPLAGSGQVARYVLKLGDTLQSVSGSILGDPRRWRELARANGIDDPRALPAGLPLRIPGAG